MYWDVVEVRAEPERRLFVRFRDDLSGYVHFKDNDLTGVLSPLRDPDFFGRVIIDHGAVAWPGEIDLAPDAMHAEISRQQAAA